MTNGVMLVRIEEKLKSLTTPTIVKSLAVILEHLRASVITHWVQVYDLRKAQYLAGHRHVSSTEAYKQQVLDELQADVKKFHPF